MKGMVKIVELDEKLRMRCGTVAIKKSKSVSDNQIYLTNIYIFVWPFANTQLALNIEQDIS